MRDIAADAGLAGPDVNDVRIRVGHGQTPNRANTFFVKERRPCHRAVRRLPNATAGGSEVVRGGIAGNARRGQRAPTAKRPDEPVLHALEHSIFVFLGLWSFSLLLRRLLS